ncbi:MAG: Two-component transcriptional response regulator, LuxR family, partial [uncultured Quadrisphaera sp.]
EHDHGVRRLRGRPREPAAHGRRDPRHHPRRRGVLRRGGAHPLRGRAPRPGADGRAHARPRRRGDGAAPALAPPRRRGADAHGGRGRRRRRPRRGRRCPRLPRQGRHAPRADRRGHGRGQRLLAAPPGAPPARRGHPRAHRARAPGAHRHGPGALQRRDRAGAVPLRGHREDPRPPPVPQARRRRPRPRGGQGLPARDGEL